MRFFENYIFLLFFEKNVINIITNSQKHFFKYLYKIRKNRKKITL